MDYLDALSAIEGDKVERGFTDSNGRLPHSRARHGTYSVRRHADAARGPGAKGSACATAQASSRELSLIRSSERQSDRTYGARAHW